MLIMLVNKLMDVWVAKACGIISLLRRLAGKFVCSYRVTYSGHGRWWNYRWEIISVTQQQRKPNSVTTVICWWDNELWSVGETAICDLWVRQRVVICWWDSELWSVCEIMNCDLWVRQRVVICGWDSELWSAKLMTE
jgi:hypothetical protein